MPPRTAYTIADLALAEKRVREGLIMIAEQHIQIEQSRVRGEDTHRGRPSLNDFEQSPDSRHWADRPFQLASFRCRAECGLTLLAGQASEWMDLNRFAEARWQTRSSL